MSASIEDFLQAKLGEVLAGNEALELPLYEEGSELLIGDMRPLTSCHLDRMDVIEKLTNWRNANMSNFLTDFEATPARTRSWIQNDLLKSYGQMLWLICYQNGELVGHIGFKNLTSQTAQLDNAMRGERYGHPKLLVVAGNYLVKWLWQTTPVKRIDAYVMADNATSIMMSRQIGFQGWKRYPLIKRMVKDFAHWDVGQDGQKSPDGRYCYHIFIERSSDLSMPTAAIFLPRCQIY